MSKSDQFTVRCDVCLFNRRYVRSWPDVTPLAAAAYCGVPAVRSSFESPIRAPASTYYSLSLSSFLFALVGTKDIHFKMGFLL